MTNEQIAASRDYNLSVLWMYAQRRGTKPADQAIQHMIFLSSVYDDMETLKALWIDTVAKPFLTTTGDAT